MITIIDIERTVLSSLLFNSELLNQCNLKVEDFYLFDHQLIYNAIEELIKEDLPIDENFIIKKIGAKKEQSLINVITTNPISNIYPYILEVKEESRKRKINTQLNLLRAKNDMSAKELMIEIEKTFLNNSELNLDLNSIKISNTEYIKAEKPTFYLEEIIPIQKKEINMFTSAGGGGKSFTLLKILLELSKRKIKCFGYFSEDSIGSTKNRIDILRNIDSTLNENIDIVGKDQPLKPFIEFDKNKNLKQTDFFYSFKKLMKPYDVICIDPLIAISGEDENNNTQARFLMNLLNEWIEKENKTLLIIHHHNKGKNSTSRGATAFIDAVRIHYEVEKKDNNDSDRFLKLKKTNHYQGKNEFKINLFKGNSISKLKNQKKQGLNITIIDDDIESEESINKTKQLKQKGFNFE